VVEKSLEMALVRLDRKRSISTDVFLAYKRNIAEVACQASKCRGLRGTHFGGHFSALAV
jgi:hypothetical protein